MKIAKFEANYFFMNKNVTGRILFLAISFFFSATVWAQYYEIGSEKSAVTWSKMKSRNFEIVYPGGYFTDEGRFKKDTVFKSLAEGYLRKVEALYGFYADSVRYNYGLPDRFPMMLHPFNAESNGITVWAPRQIDFFAQPPVDAISTEPWDLSLASHEGRHAWQMAHMNRGFFKVLYWLFGDHVIGAASGIYPSRWFLEGDAVVAETQLSRGGRGRSGFFLCEIIKCIVPEDGETENHFYGKNRSWDRWRFGSVKAYSPSPYSTGYMINAMARHHTGDVDLAHKILNYEPLHFMSANVVASAFKNAGGKTHREYVKDSMLREFVRLNENEEMEEVLSGDAAESMWDNPVARTGLKQGYYAEYKYITAVGKDSVVAVMEGNASPGILVLFTKEGGSWKEKVLRPFEAEAEKLSYHDGKLWWSECNTDPRWEQHSVYAPFSYDLKSGRIDEYNYPYSIHLPQVVDARTDGNLYGLKYEYDRLSGKNDVYSLNSVIERVIEGSQSGAVSQGEESGPAIRVKGQITSYVFHPSSREVFFTCVGENGLSLLRGRSYSSGIQIDTLISSSIHIIKDLSVHEGDLFFLSDMFGVPVLCRMNPGTKEIRLACTSGDLSGYSIAEDGSLYIVKEVGDLGSLPFKEQLVSVPVTAEMEYHYPLAEELTRQYQDRYGKIEEAYQKKMKSMEIEEDEDNFKDQPYSKGKNLFKIHSWSPVYADYSGETSGDFDSFYSEAMPGVTAHSQNNLGTMRASVGYAFERRSNPFGSSKNLHSGHANIIWSGWYPIIEGAVHFNDRVMYAKGRHSLRSGVAMYIPLTWNGNGWNEGLTPSLSWTFRNDQKILEEDPLSATGYSIRQVDRHQLNLSLGAYRMQSVAKAQVYPRWGIGGKVMASLSPNGGKNFGSQYSAYIYGYVPGLTFNQGLRLSAMFQRQMVEGHRYWQDNHLDNPRGFTEDIYGRNVIRVTADYAVPVYLGDVSLGPIAYLQQLQMIPFIDYSKVDFFRKTGAADPGHFQWEDRYSFGADVLVKGHFLRIGFPMYIGVRYARTNKPCDLGNATLGPAGTYDGKGSKNFVSLLLGITID